MKYNSKTRVALVCRGGPENGPFSAMAARIISEGLAKMDISISAIYASSGSVPTAFLGCTGDWRKLCDIWANIGPEDVVGKVGKARTSLRILREESILDNKPLGELIKKNWDLGRIFSPEAIPIKFPAVDISGNNYVIFSNRIPGHKRWFLEGALGSMGLSPFLPPQRVFNAESAELVEKGRAKNDSLLLIDGGYMGNMLLEEAMRDRFDVIFLIDIHGLKLTESNFDAHKKYHWTKYLRSGLHILSSTNDLRQFQMDSRINEELRIKKEDEIILQDLLDIRTEVPEALLHKMTGVIKKMRDNIQRMNEGRLRLGDKDETEIHIVSSREDSALFNFASFTKHKETVHLLSAGHEAAGKTLREIGLV